MRTRQHVLIILAGVLLVLFLPAAVAQRTSRSDLLALTPPMGWNSWNKFACNVNEEMIRGMADAMVKSGMNDAGYQYVNVDDCWQVSRDANGDIVADPQRFPHGMKALGDYITRLVLSSAYIPMPARKPAPDGPEAWGTNIRMRFSMQHGVSTMWNTIGATPRRRMRKRLTRICVLHWMPPVVRSY